MSTAGPSTTLPAKNATSVAILRMKLPSASSKQGAKTHLHARAEGLVKGRKRRSSTHPRRQKRRRLTPRTVATNQRRSKASQGRRSAPSLTLDGRPPAAAHSGVPPSPSLARRRNPRHRRRRLTSHPWPWHHPSPLLDVHTPTSGCGRAILACCLDIRFRARLVAHSRRRPSKNPTSGLNGNEGELRLLRFPLVMTAPAMDGHGADTTARTTGGPPASAAGTGTGVRAGARIEAPGPGDRTAALTAAAIPGGRAVLPVAMAGADDLRGAHHSEHDHHSDTGLLPGLLLPGAACRHCSFGYPHSAQATHACSRSLLVPALAPMVAAGLGAAGAAAAGHRARQTATGAAPWCSRRPRRLLLGSARR